MANSNPTIFLFLQGIKKLVKCLRQTKALIISLYSVPKQSRGEVWKKHWNDIVSSYPLVSPSKPLLQQIHLSVPDIPQLTNKCFLLCTCSEVLSKRNLKSKYENTGKTSFKTLMCVTTADIKTGRQVFLGIFQLLGIVYRGRFSKSNSLIFLLTYKNLDVSGQAQHEGKRKMTSQSFGIGRKEGQLLLYFYQMLMALYPCLFHFT